MSVNCSLFELFAFCYMYCTVYTVHSCTVYRMLLSIKNLFDWIVTCHSIDNFLIFPKIWGSLMTSYEFKTSGFKFYLSKMFFAIKNSFEWYTTSRILRNFELTKTFRGTFDDVIGGLIPNILSLIHQKRSSKSEILSIDI